MKATGYFIDHTDKLEVEAKKLIYRIGEDIKDYYEIGEKVGGGNPKQARAFRAKHKITGEVKAVKIVWKGDIKNKRDFVKSVELNVTIDHPGILTYSEVYEDTKNFYLVGDLMSGELWDHLSKSKKFTESDAAYITQQMLQAVNYLHHKGIVHRNIRPSNILVKEEGKWDIMLIDFDFAKELPSG